MVALEVTANGIVSSVEYYSYRYLDAVISRKNEGNSMRDVSELAGFLKNLWCAANPKLKP